MFGRVRKLFTWRKDTKTRNEPLGALNPINELQILRGHKTAVRFVAPIDEERIASAGDDSIILIWRYETGQCLKQLKGHYREITCMVVNIDRDLLISGSADKTIKIWNLTSGECQDTLEMKGPVQCLTLLHNDNFRFCSGGLDKMLYAWRCDGGAIASVERPEPAGLLQMHCMLPLPGHLIAVGTDAQDLAIYCVGSDTVRLQYQLPSEGSVRALALVSEKHFASATVDGGIIVWTISTMRLMRLSFGEGTVGYGEYLDGAVSSLLALNESHLAATIGSEFAVFDIISGQCTVVSNCAHDAACNSILTLYNGTIIVTASTDATIRLWGAPGGTHEFDFDTKEHVEPPKSMFGRPHEPMIPVCLGELYAHADSVLNLVACSEESFASCGLDSWVILWKDGRTQTELRNHLASLSLMQYSYEDDNALDQQFGSATWMQDDGGEVEEFNELARLPTPPPAAGGQGQTSAEGREPVASVRLSIDTELPTPPPDAVIADDSSAASQSDRPTVAAVPPLDYGTPSATATADGLPTFENMYQDVPVDVGDGDQQGPAAPTDTREISIPASPTKAMLFKNKKRADSDISPRSERGEVDLSNIKSLLATAEAADGVPAADGAEGGAMGAGEEAEEDNVHGEGARASASHFQDTG